MRNRRGDEARAASRAAIVNGARGVALTVSILVGALAPAAARAQARVPNGFRDELVADTLSTPTGIAFLPDGRLLVTEQGGRLRLVDQRPGLEVGIVGTVPSVNGPSGERGLLGVAVDPGWPARPYVYLHHTSFGASANVVRISRFTLTGDLDGHLGSGLALDPASRYDLIADAPDNVPRHNGGTVRFGTDGMLYASLGEDATACAAQDTVSLRGVVLRLDVSRLPAGGGSASRALVTPADNPFIASPNPDARLVWAYGFRNPFRFHVDRATGALFVADAGESSWEELDRVDRGGLDFGWPLYEGPAVHAVCAGVGTRPLETPIWSYRHVTGQLEVIIGAGVYRSPGAGASSAFPAEYEGDAFASDYYDGTLWRLHGTGAAWDVAAPVAGQPSADHWATGLSFVSDYAVGRDGALWYCRQIRDLTHATRTGQVRRIATGTSVDTVARGLDFAAPFPAPSSGHVSFTFTLARAGDVTLDVIDVRGRIVRRLLRPRALAAGPQAVAWDGLDDSGRRAPSGCYFAQLTVSGARIVRRVSLIR